MFCLNCLHVITENRVNYHRKVMAFYYKISVGTLNECDYRCLQVSEAVPNQTRVTAVCSHHAVV